MQQEETAEQQVRLNCLVDCTGVEGTLGAVLQGSQVARARAISNGPINRGARP